MFQPFLALEHPLVHLQCPFLRPQAPRVLSRLLDLSTGGGRGSLDVCHDHPNEPFPDLHNGLGVLLCLPVPSRQLPLQVLHRLLGILQEPNTLRFDLLNEVIEEGEDLRDLAVERVGQSADEVHIEGLGNRSDRGGELEREVIQDVFDSFAALAFSTVLREHRMKFGVGLGGRSGGGGGG